MLGPAISPEINRALRDTNTDSRPVRRLGFDRKLPSDRAQPLLHAGQTKAGSCVCRFRSESCAGVGDAKLDLIALTRQLNLGRCGSAVLHDVPQSLLRDPKKAQGHVCWDVFRYPIMDKVNLQV